MEVEMIDTANALTAFLDNLPQPSAQPNFFIDLEGNNLSRHGTLSLITILVEPRHKVHLIDVHTLGTEAFTTPNTNNTTTLQQILESETIAKVFFDIRHDSDALFGLYGIRVSGIEDLQLMELGSRSRFENKRYVSGLAKCIQNYTQLSWVEKQQFKVTKDQGKRLFDPARGGSYAVFDRRPLDPEVAKYCAQDVLHMPGLYDVFRAKLSASWKEKVKEETAARISLSQSAQGVGRGPQNAQGPKGWAPQTKKPAMGAYKHASSSQMWDDDAATDAYNDNLLSQLRKEDDAVDEYNDNILSQLWEEDDW